MRPLLALLLPLLLVLGACHAPVGERIGQWLDVAGTDDVALTYQATAAEAGDLRPIVMRRLSAARLGADVAHEGTTVRIVIDEDLAGVADELLSWTGAIALAEVDARYPLPPRDGLASVTVGDERWYEGPRAAVVEAVRAWSVDKTHQVVAEPLAGSASRYRTRVVRMPAVAELAEGTRIGWGEGASLRLRTEPGSPAAAALDAAQARSAAVPLVTLRGRQSLGAPTFEGDGSLLLRFGSGPEAYARAQRERLLLMTPRLPPLRRTGAIGLPTNRLLATACVVVPVVLSLAWLAFVRRFDRAYPEPRWLVGATFVLGAVATAPAAFIESTLARASPWLDPRLVTFGGRPFAFPLALAVFTFVIGVPEEVCKRLAAELPLRRPEFDEPIDGIVYGIVASLGFAAAENIRYFALGRMSAPLVVARCFMSVPAHMFFGALWGYALGARLVDPRTRRWLWLGLAAGCHGLFDALLSIEGAGGLAVLLNVVLAGGFVVLVRRALRHGMVTADGAIAGAAERVLFRVGRPLWFWLSAILFHLLALGIFFLGASWQMARHRPSATFVVISAALVALLAVAALGVAGALPLDVVLDNVGVTFAGATRPWRKIRGYTLGRNAILLACDAGAMRLGPATAQVLQSLSAALDGRLGANRPQTLESAPLRADGAGEGRHADSM